MGLQIIGRDLGARTAGVEVEGRVQRHQVLVARPVLGEEDHRRGRVGVRPLRSGVEGEVDLAAHDGLDARLEGRDGELEGREHVVGVGQGDRRHVVLRAKARQGLQANGTLQKRVFGMHAEVDESGALRHGPTICCGQGSDKARMAARPKNFRNAGRRVAK